MLGKVARIGRQAALAAGAVMRQNYPKPQRVTLKGAIDPVTETDYQAQETIVAIIRQAFPDHDFLAEERQREGGGAAPLPEGSTPTRLTLITPLTPSIFFKIWLSCASPFVSRVKNILMVWPSPSPMTPGSPCCAGTRPTRSFT